MPRLRNGNIRTITPEADYRSRLFTSGVIRSRSGPEGWQIVDSPELLELFFKDSENYNSYKRLVEAGVDLIMAKQSNPINYPNYSVRLTSNPVIPTVYPISTTDYSEMETVNTDDPLGEEVPFEVENKILYENYSFAYILKLNAPMVKSDYIVLPLLDRDEEFRGLNLIIYAGADSTPIDIPLENFRSTFALDTELDVQGQLHSIADYLEHVLTVPYRCDRSQLDQGILKIESSDAHVFRNFVRITDGSLEKDYFRNLDLMVATTLDQSEVEFVSKIYGPRSEDIVINLKKIPFTNDYTLRVSLDNFSEAWRVEFNGGTDHFVEDVLIDSKIISAIKLKNLNRDISGDYGFLRHQDPLPYDLSDELLNPPSEVAPLFNFYLSERFFSNLLVADIIDNLSVSKNLTMRYYDAIYLIPTEIKKKIDYYVDRINQDTTIADICSWSEELNTLLRALEFTDLNIPLSTVRSLMPSSIKSRIDSELETYSLRKVWEQLEEIDLLYFMALDDGLQNLTYIQWIQRYVMSTFDTYLILNVPESLDISGNVVDFPIESDKILNFPQSMHDIDNQEVLSYIPTLIKIYDETFLGSISNYVVSNPQDIENKNEYEISDHIIELNHLITTDSKDAIEMLIIRSFIKRLNYALTDILSSDDYSMMVTRRIDACMQRSSMMDECKILEMTKVNLNTLRLKLSLSTRKYSTGTIILNFTINLKS